MKLKSDKENISSESFRQSSSMAVPPPSVKTCGFSSLVDVLLLSATVLVLCWAVWLTQCQDRLRSMAFLFQSAALIVVAGLSCSGRCRQCVSLMRTAGGVAVFALAARDAVRTVAASGRRNTGGDVEWKDLTWYGLVYLGNILLVVVFAAFSSPTCEHYLYLSAAQAAVLLFTGIVPLHTLFK